MGSSWARRDAGRSAFDTATARSPVWYGGGKLAADLTLPKLRRRWDAAGSPAEDPFTAAERGAVWDHVARVADDAAARIRMLAEADPALATDAAWAAADTLHVAAAALDSRILRQAAEAYDRAARASYGRVPASTPTGTSLRRAARLLAAYGYITSDPSFRPIVLITRLAALVEAVAGLRQAQEHAAQAASALRAAEQLQEAGRAYAAADRRPAQTAVALADAGFPGDLVGFTAASDRADPEDVRARIRPYHARLRREIEGFGGTVEKFIGDAVMAVFGAPAAHEDDPERAVRAGLRILDAIADLNQGDAGLGLAVRVGVETGEAVVALGARPELGEGLVAGDVVNTASRLQGVAPVGGVVAGPGAHAATREVFDYRPLDRVVLKGKAQPVPVFHALAARARLGTDVTRSLGTPLVGRKADLGMLTGALDRAVAESAVQLVVVAGEPGVGKSRLVAELGSVAGSRAELIRWRQGRCLPYGDGVTFWALGEIVKAEAGILETDLPETAAAKIDAIIPEDAADAPWLRARLRPLAGLVAPQAAREENFAAWRAWIELLAEARPTVLVVEDLHWADPVLLEFLEQLAADVQGVPLLLVGTTRPELFGTAPAWGAPARNLARVNLAPLGPADTARLITGLLGTAVLPAGMQQAIAGRCGGNPLYAEQFVRLLQDQHILTGAGPGRRTGPGAQIPLPPGVHGLIAARLDMLPAERKRLLHDAAVVGTVFWSGALAGMGNLGHDQVRAGLHELARTDLIRPARRPTMAGQAEYAFTHALIREVCYGQLPRAERAQRHQRAAAWIEATAGERAADHADILAVHYTTALDLARAANDPHAGELAASAARYLTLAGDRAMRIDVAAAERHYHHALQLTGDTGPSRAELLTRHAEALRQRGRFTEAVRTYEQAIELFRARGDVIALAQANDRLRENPRAARRPACQDPAHRRPCTR